MADTATPSTAGPVLSPEGENLVLLNRELFLENERFREQIRMNGKLRLQKFELGSFAPTEILTTFRIFGRMPRELRDLVWTFAVQDESRVMEFHCLRSGSNTRFISKSGSPVSLLVCHEARKIGLMAYQKLEWPQFDSVYVSWERDIIFIRPGDFVKFLAQIDLDETKGFNCAASENDHALVKAGKNSAHQQINRNCRNLAFSTDEAPAFHNANLTHTGRYARAMKNLLLISSFTRTSKHEQGKITLEHIPNPDAHILPLGSVFRPVYKAFTSSQYGLQNVSFYNAARDNTMLMTEEEKDDRRKVKEGEMKEAVLERKKEAKAAAALAKMPKRQREEAIRKNDEKAKATRMWDDLALAQQLQLEDEKRGRGGRLQ